MPIIKQVWVKTTPTIEAALAAIEPHVPEDLTLTITSGLRDAHNQLNIIAGYASEHDIRFPEYTPGDVDRRVFVPELGREVYAWQRTWSALLRNTEPEDPGIVINPPRDAECLDDYIRPGGENMKGRIILATPHASGDCFDERADDRETPFDDIPRKVEVLTKAKAAGAPIRGWRVERKNNALHVDCIHKEG